MQNRILGVNFVVIDIETTGLKPQEERITEICALQYTNTFKYRGALYNNLTNPVKSIPKFITELTGITQDMVKYKPYYTEAVKELAQKASKGDNVFIAHNARFEYDWLSSNLTYYKDIDWICTRALFLFIKDGNTWENNFKRNYSKLKQVCQHFGVEYKEEDAHRAEYDVIKTAIVAEMMIQVIGFEKALEISKAYMFGNGYGKRRQIDMSEMGVF